MIFLKILVRMSSLAKAILQSFHPKATNWSAFSLGCLFLILASCASTKHVETVAVETLHHDTLYINKEHYDSIYIDRASEIDRTRDTITITKTMTEYRFRFLRDTIRIAKRDSIPYEVIITEVKEVPRPRNLFDYISYVCTIVITTIIVLKLIITTKRIIL